MTSPLPPPPSVLKTYPAHLDSLQQSAAALRQAAEAWESAFDQQRTYVRGLPWSGDSADKAHATVDSDQQIVSQQAEQLRQISEVQTYAIPELKSSYDAVIKEIDATEKDGFQVTETYAVVDTRQSTSVIDMLEREEKAEGHAANLTSLVGKFWQQELSTSSKLSGMADVHAFDFQHDGNNGQQNQQQQQNTSQWRDQHGQWWQSQVNQQQPHIVGGGIPDRWHTTQWDDPNHGHYDPNYPTPATPYEAAHHGSNFEDNVKIDTSHATSTGPDDSAWPDKPPVKGDIPSPVVGAPSFVSQYEQQLTAAPTPNPAPPVPLPSTPPAALHGPNSAACRDAIDEQQTQIEQNILGATVAGAAVGGAVGGALDGVGAIPGALMGATYSGLGTAFAEIRADHPTPGVCE